MAWKTHSRIIEGRKPRERKEPGWKPQDERVKGAKIDGWRGYGTGMSTGGMRPWTGNFYYAKM